MAVIVYDDDCDFCSSVVYDVFNNSEHELRGFSQLKDEERDVLPDDYEECSHVIDNDTVFSCEDGLVWALKERGYGKIAVVLEKLGILNFLGYHLVASNRSFFGRLYYFFQNSKEKEDEMY